MNSVVCRETVSFAMQMPRLVTPVYAGY